MIAEVENSDSHRLHIFHGGIFSDHFWKQVKCHIEVLFHEAVKQVDSQYMIILLNLQE